ncbi:MAG: filamentous hemagglutinin N-terminal domain-containing protein [Nostoc sp.]
MSASVQYWWRLALGSSLIVGGAIIASSGNCAKAQSITLDGTLGPAQTLTGPDYVIPQAVGQTVSNNLFHSFGQFNLNTNESVTFENAANIRNILSRVTGGTPSAIDGLIRTSNNGVNLFLINPQGIIFGPNAQLNIGNATRGSFIATTVDGIVFPNGEKFSAINPEGESSLLRIVGDPSGFLASQRLPAQINSIGNILQVNEGQTLTLLGGKVNVDSSQLFAPGGRVELGGVAGGNVGLVASGNELRLEFPDGLARNDVSVANSLVSVEAQDKGSIAINAQNLDISEGSLLVAGIGKGLGTVSSQAGDITLNATQTVKVRQASNIANYVFSNATGNSGNLIVTTGSLFIADGSQLGAITFGQGNAGSVNITTGSLFVTDGSQLGAITFGEGNAGSVIINARDRVSFDGGTNNGFSSAAISSVEETAKGRGGDIRITTGELALTNGAQLVANTLGQGDAGSVIINARDRVFLAGNIGSNVEKTGKGKGGDIRITTNSLSVTNGAQLVADTSGLGDAGSVIVNANDRVSFDGRNSDNNISSAAFTSVAETGIGKGGDIRITTKELSLTNGAQLVASTLGNGNAGSISIDARDRIFIDGTSKGALVPTAVGSSVEKTGKGKGGDIGITTNSLSLTNGALLIASTSGQGDAGNITIDARDRVALDGTSSKGQFGSDVVTSVENGRGNGGNISITTDLLSVTNGAQLVASTSGQGDAGNIIINARDRAWFDGTGSNNIFVSAAFSSVLDNARGNGGGIDITTGSLLVTNGAQLIANTRGQGNAGEIIINARDRVSFDGESRDGILTSAAFSNVLENAKGKGGNISITTGELSVNNGAQLIASTRGQGDAGNIIIDARDRVVFNGRSSDGEFGSNAFSRVEETGIGKGGDIRITTGEFSVSNGAQLIASTYGQGDAGNIYIDAPNTAFLQGTGNGFSSSISTNTWSEQGEGGNITIDTNDFRIADGALLDARTRSSRRAGSITINTNAFEATNGGQLITSTESSGQAGDITLNVTGNTNIFGSDPTYTNRLAQFSDRVENVSAVSGVFANTNSQTEGKGGDISINARTLNIQDSGRIAVNSQGTGEGGNIDIKANNLTLKNQAIISAETLSSQGGNIDIGLKDTLLLRQGSQISTNAGIAQQGGDGGNITINVPDGFIVAVPRENSDITANAFSGSGGRVTINATGIFGIAPLSRQELERLRPNDLDPHQLITNDITAISQTSPNLSGTVTLNTPDINLNRGLVNLPSVPLNTEVSQVCQVRSAKNQSSFIITGSGGLPPNPRTEPLSSDAVQVDWVSLKPMDEKLVNTSTQITSPIPAPIVEAQGWVRNVKGEVVLTAYAPTATPRNSWQIPTQCSTAQSIIK